MQPTALSDNVKIRGWLESSFGSSGAPKCPQFYTTFKTELQSGLVELIADDVFFLKFSTVAGYVYSTG
ncbi:hypothetical protein HAX54_030418 [Datura stramonium]|uniref:Uncharacterized protein n=1 Tax=Datura stramonium TaxID=4076 RepID=A0ABS8SB08_DATST|nr:hypothetical protein [Datura stramonium]